MSTLGPESTEMTNRSARNPSMRSSQSDATLNSIRINDHTNHQSSQSPSATCTTNGSAPRAAATTFKFGRLTFEKKICRPGITEHQFVKVSPDVDIAALFDAMTTEWNLCIPDFVLSVTGGAWDFPRNNVVREVFRKGLVEACVSIDRSMIITGGTETGAMKYTANALRNYELAHGPCKTVTLGVVTWGPLPRGVKDKLDEAITNKDIVVKLDSKDNEESTPLDPNHGHFILVDDGTNNLGADVLVRSKLVQHIKTYSEDRLHLTANQVTCSSTNHASCMHGHIQIGGPKAWEADTDSNSEWISVDLGCTKTVTGVMVQGNPTDDKWITEFKVLYSHNEVRWFNVDTEFDGNKDRTTKETTNFDKAVRARYFKIQPMEWHGKKPSMRFDLLAVTCSLPKNADKPTVCVIIEGGKNSILQACEAVKRGTPLVVVASSGRAADVLAYAFEERRERSDIKAKLMKIVSEKSDVNECLQLIEDASNCPELLSIYNGGKIGIRDTILWAFIKEGKHNTEMQLEIAHLWNDVDIIEDEIFLSRLNTTNWDSYEEKVEFLQNFFFKVMACNQVKFVKFFMDKDLVNLSSFLTWDRLKNLYKEVDHVKPNKYQYRIQETDQDVLQVVDDVMQELVVDTFAFYGDQKDNEPPVMPLRDLFIFALVNDFFEMALYFWEEGFEHIGSALVACTYYRCLADKIEGTRQEEKEDLEMKYKKFEALAYQALNVCETKTLGNDTFYMLIRELRSWGNKTCPKFAELSNSSKFLAHTSVQTLLNDVWRNGLNEHPSDEEIASKAFDEKSLWNKCKGFVVSPQCVFYQNVVMYVLFLALFSWIMVSDQLKNNRPSHWEWLLIAWGITFILEEIRQICVIRPKEYIRCMWNWVDMFMLLTFVIGIILRLTENTRNSARVVLAFSLFGFYFRLLHVLTIFKHTGPKVLMVRRMMFDVLVFIAILSVVMTGYCFTTKVIMYPHVTDQSLELGIAHILYRSYFQIYGELFLEDITAKLEDGTCTNDRNAIIEGAAPCPENVGWGIVCLVLYMLFSNVLLLNLLIAMFSHTFEEVQTENDILWKYMRFEMIKEYYKKPVLAPPFIVFGHLYRFLRYILNLGSVPWNSPVLKCCLSKSADRKVAMLEERCVYSYILARRSEQQDKVRAESVPDDLEELSKQVEQLKKDIDKLSAAL